MPLDGELFNVVTCPEFFVKALMFCYVLSHLIINFGIYSQVLDLKLIYSMKFGA